VDIPALFNLFEAALWGTISAVLVFKWIRSKPGARPFHWNLAVAFALFGVSDLIEVQTGAWWRPWWLFVLKAGCALVFLRAFLIYRRGLRKLQRHSSDEDLPEPQEDRRIEQP